MASEAFDFLIVGRGIVGLAHALAAARHAWRVAVIDRETRSTGASVRNFGFVTVTGQEAGITWRRARRARDIWAEVAPQAGVAIHHRGLVMAARRPEAMAVIEQFAAGPMGAGCMLRGANSLPPPFREGHAGALFSPHELRVESRDAVPRLAAWLAETHGVTFLPPAVVHEVEPGRVQTGAGTVHAAHVVVCPGPDLQTLFPEEHARRALTLCKLHMLRVAAPGWRLPAAVMSDLGLVRYLGYANCPALPALRARLEAEQGAWLADGIHLIAVQGADGSLVVGDSHHYDPSPDPFQPREIDDRILAELSAVLDLPAPDVIERWTGVYPSGAQTAFIAAPAPGVRLVNVTSGTGASTAFAIAEETLADLLGLKPPPHTQGSETA
jgi:FAD dependent oxidoreductase TIGR03364